MQRRFNYTGRRRIDRGDIKIALRPNEESIAFDADLSGLRSYRLPPESLVFVEAYRQTIWMRFEFGTAGAISPPVNRNLSLFDSPEGILFRVKVTSAAYGHTLIAEADSIPLRASATSDANRMPLLPVKPQGGMSEIFKVDFSGNSPILLINSDVGNYADIAMSRWFISMAYPGILREILTRILLVDGHDDSTDEDDWRSRWLKFSTLLPGVMEFQPEAEMDDKIDWMDTAVTSFAQKIETRRVFSDAWEAAA